jgi:hypothetical protein
MGFAETMIFYHLIGVGVAAAVFLSDTGRGALSRGFRVASAVVFWPLYLPILLARPSRGVMRDAALPAGDRDEMAEAIARVEAELEAALSSLDGWAEGVMAIEADRIRELRAAWTAQAGRIREMDRLLACEGSTGPGSPAAEAGSAGASGIESSERCRRSEEARRSNLDRLRRVRHQAHEDLMGTLAWVRELVSMIHLAKFTGAPASRAEELVAQIASAVKGMSAVTWQDAFQGEGA